MIQNQEHQPEEVEEAMPEEAVGEEPPLPQQEIQDEGRKIYVTKSGEKYHLSRRCDTLKAYRSYERRACEFCKERTRQILTLNPNGRQSQSESELTFIHENEEYHHQGCTRLQGYRRKGTRPICKVCEDEELTLLWARNRTHKHEKERMTERLESKIKDQRSKVNEQKSRMAMKTSNL